MAPTAATASTPTVDSSKQRLAHHGMVGPSGLDDRMSMTMSIPMTAMIDFSNSDDTNIQRAVTLGKMSLEEFRTSNRTKRLELYASVHSNQECMVASLEKYLVEEPWTKKLRTLTYDGYMDDDLTHAEAATNNNSGGGGNSSSSSSGPFDSAHASESGGNGITTTTPTPTVVPTADRVTRHQHNHTDIYGRIPPKEPKALAKCSICDREVAVTRFAPHLDKCMNLGNNRSATNTGTSATTTTTTSTTTNTTTAGASGKNNSTSSSSSKKHH